MKKRFLLIIIIITATLIVGCKGKSTNNVVDEKYHNSSHGPKIEFRETTHNFDTINITNGGKYIFHYSNIGDQPLVISNVLTNCGCLTTRWSPTPLQPGESDSISIQITTRHLGNLMKAVVIRSNAINEPVVTLRISGYVIQQ